MRVLSEARLVFCRACKVGRWFKGALPQPGDDSHVCADCEANR